MKATIVVAKWKRYRWIVRGEWKSNVAIDSGLSTTMFISSRAWILFRTNFASSPEKSILFRIDFAAPTSIPSVYLFVAIALHSPSVVYGMTEWESIEKVKRKRSIRLIWRDTPLDILTQHFHLQTFFCEHFAKIDSMEAPRAAHEPASVANFRLRLKSRLVRTSTLSSKPPPPLVAVLLWQANFYSFSTTVWRRAINLHANKCFIVIFFFDIFCSIVIVIQPTIESLLAWLLHRRSRFALSVASVRWSAI